MTDDKVIDPLMMELFDRLPTSGSTWPLDERLLWLSACEAVLNLIYGPVDRVVLDLPGMTLKAIGPDISTGVTKGRLARDTDGRLTLTKRGRDMVSADLRLKNKGEFPAPAVEKAIREAATAHGIDPDVAATVAKIESKSVDAQAAPKPAQLGSIKFEHEGRVAMLSTGREYSIAGKLRAAMGKGHVAEAFLAETVLGSNTENNRLVVRDICRNLCTPLAEAGLTIEHYPGFGLVMKEV